MDMCVHHETRGLTADDRAFLDRLVTTMGPRLLAYARRMQSRTDAEDVVAETFFRAADSIAALRASPRPEFYLLSVARNLCRDQIRRNRITRAILPAPAPVPTPPECAVAAEDLAALRVAVDELPDRLREVVVLRLAGGLRFEDIAALLQISLGTALSRMHSAVERLKEKVRYVPQA